MTLPESWETIQLAECQARTTTVDPRKEPLTKFDLFSVPSYSDATPDQVTGADIGSAKQEVEPGDVLLCKIVPHIRRGWVVPPPSGRAQIASGEWIVFRDTPLEPNFLRRFVLSDEFHDQFMRTVSGVGGSLMRARPAEAGKIKVPVPPLAEQRRIVAKLDALTARLARARAELDRVPVLVRDFRKRTLGQMFAGDWANVVDLGSLTLPSAPIRYGVLQPGGEKGSGVQMIRVCDLHDMQVAWPSLRRIAPEIDRQFSSARVQDGDVLISVVGTIGRIAVVFGMKEPTNIARAVARLRPDTSKVHPMWLALRLAAEDCQKMFAADAREVARKTLNVSLIKATPIALPPLSVQAAAVRTLTIAFARADRLEAEAARARALIDQLEAAILARAFRGELVPQDPNDEPASVLLDRIRAERAAAPKAKRGRRAKADA
ncbi:hypothetical protein FPZ54_12515 [Sphingomonas suaedae]|uniref:Restriction endonuclease subunit S n=1 Tax=Sphingomonas suaedae TaxID=2599297 RepID=A0A518RH39_9SPHN|nr:hypothetical protein [Sphingomonas suaedae]QDX26751.1 hypothetical protein FPZ54_12515 [Sphingomonas suaedae]